MGAFFLHHSKHNLVPGSVVFDHDKLAPQSVAPGDAPFRQDKHLVRVTDWLAKLEQVGVAVGQIAQGPQCEVFGFAMAGKYVVLCRKRKLESFKCATRIEDGTLTSSNWSIRYPTISAQ